jgi:hypothetical protein
MLVSLEANSKEEGLAYLNTIRKSAGLIELKSNKTLDNAAAAHAKYLIQNQTNGHYQKKGKYAFTETTPSKRVTKAGYPTTYVMENLSINTNGYVKSVDNLFSAIYHRFVFLNLDKDEIGIGRALSNKKRKINRAYVYDMGSSGIAKLCDRSYSMAHGVYYMKNICQEKSKMVPRSLFEEKKEVIRRRNKDIILYPYAGQRDIWPAFYNESPDPLPGYNVSGFPISVQFNPAYYKDVKLKSFRLFNENGKEIKETKILQQNNDRNKLFTNLEFALMPLKRLEFDTSYSAYFEAVADGKKVKKRWSFRTAKPKETLYRITQQKSKLSVKASSAAVLYVVPSSKKDIIHSYRYRGGLKVSFLDQNTLKVIFPKRRSSGKVSLDIGKRKIFFNVQ